MVFVFFSIQVLLQKFVHSFSLHFAFNCLINVFNLSMKPAHNATATASRLSLLITLTSIDWPHDCLSIYVCILYSIVYCGIASLSFALAFCLTLS